MAPETEASKPREKTEFDCGECDPCLFVAYNADDPDTHCISCTCLFCLPGG